MNKKLLRTLGVGSHNAYILACLLIANIRLTGWLLKNTFDENTALFVFWPVLALCVIGAVMYKFKFIDDLNERRNAALTRCVNALDDLCLVREQIADKSKLHEINSIWNNATRAIEQARKVMQA